MMIIRPLFLVIYGIISIGIGIYLYKLQGIKALYYALGGGLFLIILGIWWGKKSGKF